MPGLFGRRIEHAHNRNVTGWSLRFGFTERVTRNVFTIYPAPPHSTRIVVSEHNYVGRTDIRELDLHYSNPVSKAEKEH